MEMLSIVYRKLGIGCLLLGFAAAAFAQNELSRAQEELLRAQDEVARSAEESLRAQEQSSRAREQSSSSLDEARRNLEEAAREVARLSAELAGPIAEGLHDIDIRMRNFGSRARLGISIDDADEGVRVVGVTPGSGAAQAGIVTGDVIVAIDGAELDQSGDASPSELLIAQMANVEPGNEVRVRVLRGGEPRELVVTAEPGGRRSFFFRGPEPGPEQSYFTPLNLPYMFGGPFRELELVSLTPGLGAYFGTQEGLLVVRAPANAALELSDGDVILDIGGRTPTSPEHAMRILRSFEPGETLRLQIMRNQRRETLEFELPQRARGDQ